MFYTTLNKIRMHSPCCEGWRTLLTFLGKTQADDEPLSFKTILDSNGLNDAIWALRCIDIPEVRLFAVRCARQIQHLITDKRSLNAINISEAYAIGEATDDELSAANRAARDATEAVEWDKAEFVAWGVADEVAWFAAVTAAGVAARVAAAKAAIDAEGRAKRTSAWDLAQNAQKEDFIAIFCSED